MYVKSRNNGPVCFYCGEIGHVKRICEKWKKKQEEEELKSKKEKEEASCFCYQSQKKNECNESDDDIECIALVSQVTTMEHKKDWVVDSAASRHMCNNPSLMKNLRVLNEKQYIKVGNGEYVQANAEGTVKLEIKTGGVTRKFKLENVLLATELKYNLLSVAKAAEAGKTIEFGRYGCKIIDGSTRQVLGSGRKKGNLYYVNCAKQEERNSQRSSENNVKSQNRSLKNKEMKKALNFMSENNFERELMKRLDRMESEIKQSNIIIKEKKEQNPEDKNNNQEDKNTRQNNSGNEVQEDKKQAVSNANHRNYSAQEDHQIQNSLEIDLVDTENQMKVEKFLNKQNEDQNHAEGEGESDIKVDTIDNTMSEDMVDQENVAQILVEQAIKAIENQSDSAEKKQKLKRRGGFIKKLCTLKKFFSSRSKRS